MADCDGSFPQGWFVPLLDGRIKRHVDVDDLADSYLAHEPGRSVESGKQCWLAGVLWVSSIISATLLGSAA